MIHLLLVEPAALLRDALAKALACYDEFLVVSALSGTKQAKLITQRLDVLIIDICQLVNTESDFSGCAVLALVDPTVPGWIIREAGPHVRGLCSKGSRLDKLVEDIGRVSKGEQIIDSELASKALGARPNPLTPREQEVLLVASSGAKTKEIAKKVHLSEGTVRNHLSRCMYKLGVETRQQAVRLAQENGWL